MHYEIKLNNALKIYVCISNDVLDLSSLRYVATYKATYHV